MRLYRGLLAVLLVATCLVVTAPVASAANGEVLVNEWGNSVPAGGNCGTTTIEFYNASSAPVLKVWILYHTFYDGSAINRTTPFRGGKAARSWVVFNMYLKPGKTVAFRKSLCTNVPYINAQYDWQSDGRDFKPMRIDWEWA